MHRDHEVFVQGVEQEKRIELTFFCRKQQREVVSLCAPLYYSRGSAGLAKGRGNGLGCYYLWDFGAKKDSNFLALSPSEIILMKLTGDDFHVKEFYSPGKQTQIL